MSDLLPHPLAELFPRLPDGEIALLADDICTNGLNHPIVLYEGKILDGRNRLAACLFGQLEPTFTDYAGTDPLGFVLSENLRRRHLTESQRAMVAARLATWQRGTNQSTARAADLPVWRVAKMFSVSKRSVTAGQFVERHGDVDVIAAVRSGALTVSATEHISKLAKPAQRRALLTRVDRRKTKPADPLDTFKVRTGEAIGAVLWRDLHDLIQKNRIEAALLARVQLHAANADPDRPVRDVISGKEFERIRREVEHSNG
jgi:hypothetical protein